MGDMVIVLGLIEALHRRFRVPVDVVSSGAWTKPLLEGQSGVGNLHLIRSRRTPYALSPQQWQLVDTLRKRGAGPVWLCETGVHARALLTRAGIAPEWIVDTGTHCPRRPSEHNLDRWRRFAQMSPAALPEMEPLEAAAMVRNIRWPPLRVLPDWRADLTRWLHDRGLDDRPLVLVQAGNKRTMRWWAPRRRVTNSKYWPEERWAAVIGTLLRRDARLAVLLLGVPAEASLNDDIACLVRSDRVVNVARELPIPRLLALQERALGMISVDTGPAHSAAALDCPLVVLFGQVEVDRWAPRSPRGAVQVLTGNDTDDGILGIAVEDVEEGWDRLQDGIARHDSHWIQTKRRRLADHSANRRDYAAFADSGSAAPQPH
jgi:heptosyltransferase-2/heptosyltransferase-3